MKLRNGPWRGRMAAAGTTLLVMIGLLAPSAAQATTALFNEPFTGSSLSPGVVVTMPAFPSGTNQACLTASGDVAATPVPGCEAPAMDSGGSGALRLTPAGDDRVGAVFNAATIPTSAGLDAKFNLYQYGGTGADGIAFVMAAVDPATQVPPTSTGVAGGGLGYSPEGGSSGLTNGYLGVGFDRYGNFSTGSYSGTGCAAPSWQGFGPNEVTVRGPGSGTAGYCLLNSTMESSYPGPQPVLSGSTRSTSAVLAEVTINPSGSPIVNAGGFTVPANSYLVAFTGVGQTAQSFSGTLPDASGVFPPSWLDTNGVPLQLAFGWVASTAGITDIHEVTNSSLDTAVGDVATLPVTAAYVGTVSGSSGSGTLTVNPTVGSGTAVGTAVTVSLTLPSALSFGSVSGSGWTCTIMTATTASCTTIGTSYGAGTQLPQISADVNVVGSVTPEVIAETQVRTLAPSARGFLANPTVSAPTPGPNDPTSDDVLAADAKIKRNGRTRLTKRNPQTTGGSAIRTRVQCRSRSRGDLRYCSIIRRKNGAVFIRTYGYRLSVRVVWKAPATATESAYQVTRTYRT